MQKLLIAILLLSLTACYKYSVTDLSPNAGSGSNTGTFTAVINGTNWSANTLKAATIYGGLINITGKSSDGKLIAITVEDRGVASYQIFDSSSFRFVAYNDSVFSPQAFTSNNWGDDALHGNLVITKIDNATKKMSGTFNATVKHGILNANRTITNGVFTDITFSNTITNPGGGGTGVDTFRVTSNGTPFTTNNVYSSTLGGNINVQVTQADGRYITLLLNPTVTAGTSSAFSFVSAPSLYTAPSLTSTSIFFAGASPDNITILEHNLTTKRIRGTFNGVCKDFGNPLSTATYPLTAGYFSVKYP